MKLSINKTSIFKWIGIISIVCSVAAFLQAQLQYGTFNIIYFLYTVSSVFFVSYTFKGYTHDKTIGEINSNDFKSKVDIFIPCVDEPAELIIKNIKGYFKIQYPSHLFRICLLVDSERTDLEALLKNELDKGLKIIHRPNKKQNYKAGNLNYALFNSPSTADLVLVMDSDHYPYVDILKKLVPFYEENKNNFGFVQSLDFPSNIPINDWFESRTLGLNIIQGYHTNRMGPVCIGTCTLFNRNALLEVGGFFQKSLTEDLATGMLIGSHYQSYFFPAVLSTGKGALQLGAILKQRQRWADGIVQYIFSKEFWQVMPWARSYFINVLCSSALLVYSITSLYWGLIQDKFAVPTELNFVSVVSLLGYLFFRIYLYFIFRSLSTFQLIAFERFIFTFSFLLAFSLVKVPFKKLFKRKIDFYVSPKGISQNKSTLSITLVFFIGLFMVIGLTFFKLLLNYF